MAWQLAVWQMLDVVVMMSVLFAALGLITLYWLIADAPVVRTCALVPSSVLITFPDEQ